MPHIRQNKDQRYIGMFLHSMVTNPLACSKTSHFTPWQSCPFRHQLDFSRKIQPRTNYCMNTIIFPPLSIARNSVTQLSKLRCREVNENAQVSKRQQKRFEPGLSRLRVWHSTAEIKMTHDKRIIYP